MIKPEEVYQIGTFGKPHGIHGEIQLSFTDDVFDESECDYIVCPIDDILVPFFIKEYRFKGEFTALFTLEGVDSEELARQFTHLPVFFPKKYMTESDDKERSWAYFEGFKIEDEDGNLIGDIEYVNDSTANVLFSVNHLKKEILIPAQEDLILGIDHQERIITMQLPDGLLELFKE
jgi:16S rRNA processing protein RimM